jgi:hypothetical protein
MDMEQSSHGLILGALQEVLGKNHENLRIAVSRLSFEPRFPEHESGFLTTLSLCSVTLPSLYRLSVGVCHYDRHLSTA